MTLSLEKLVLDFAAALKAVDCSQPQGGSRTRTYRPGIGPLTETEAIRSALHHMKTYISRNRYSSACSTQYPGTRQQCDLYIPGEWVIEIKLIRPFGDNGNEAEHWSENILHPYPGNTSLIGDCHKLLSSGFSEKKAAMVFGYEHTPPKIELETAVKSFEVIADNVAKIKLCQREFANFSDLIHPIHQQGKVFAWEILGYSQQYIFSEQPPKTNIGRRIIVEKTRTLKTNELKSKIKYSLDSVGRKTGDLLNKEWNIGAQHAFYHEQGTWYHVLERFPGALIDRTGYIVFKTRNDYFNCSHLNIGEHTNVRYGISSINGYVRVVK